MSDIGTTDLGTTGLDPALARSALDVAPLPGLGADVAALPSRGMVTLRGDLADAGFAAALEAATGCAVPDVRRSSEAGDNRALWMSTDEVLVFCDWPSAPGMVATFMEKAGDAHVLALDVSDARAVFRIEGAKAWRVLAKGAPVDLAPGQFEIGDVRRTRIATVAAGIVKTGDEAFEVFCFRSYAAYLWNWLNVGAGAESLSDL